MLGFNMYTYIYYYLANQRTTMEKVYFWEKTNKKLSLVGACRGCWNSNEGISITRRLLIKVFEGNMCRIMQLSQPTQLRQNIFFHRHPLICKVMKCIYLVSPSPSKSLGFFPKWHKLGQTRASLFSGFRSF